MGSKTAPIIDPKQAVAVIGMHLRYPGASTVQEFWDNLRNGVESISFYNEDELFAAGIPREISRAPSFVNSFLRSRKAQASFVQPGVSSRG